MGKWVGEVEEQDLDRHLPNDHPEDGDAGGDVEDGLPAQVLDDQAAHLNKILHVDSILNLESLLHLRILLQIFPTIWKELTG